jgi:hypothetical protein
MFVRVMNRGAAAAAAEEEEQPYRDYAWNELLPLTGGVQILVVVVVLAALWISWSTVTVVSRREHWTRR